VIDISSDKTFPLAWAARNIPCLQNRRGGRPIAPSTLWRWSARGIRGIKLETVHVGGEVHTTYEALNRFFNALRKNPELPPPIPKQHYADRHADVEKQLAALGI
jgi:hypothetical protein